MRLLISCIIILSFIINSSFKIDDKRIYQRGTKQRSRISLAALPRKLLGLSGIGHSLIANQHGEGWNWSIPTLPSLLKSTGRLMGKTQKPKIVHQKGDSATCSPNLVCWNRNIQITHRSILWAHSASHSRGIHPWCAENLDVDGPILLPGTKHPWTPLTSV